jgi:putative transposase
VEQENENRPGRGHTPSFVERCRQLTEARADNPWLAGGSATVQQQAVKDHAQAMSNFFKGTHRRPSWRKASRDESFRVTGARSGQWDFRRVGRHWGELKIPRAGWVRFRWSRAVPEGVKSFRVTRDYSGRWHVAFAAIPEPIPGPGTGEVVGIDRGVKVAAALSTGEMLTVPGLGSRRPPPISRAGST